MKLFSKKRGQSVLEYTLILGVVIAAIIAALFSAPAGTSMQDNIEKAYNNAGSAISSAVGQMTSGVFSGT